MSNSRREQRFRELRRMWDTKEGRDHVLSLFHQQLPAGHGAQPGTSIFQVILDAEYGPPEAADSNVY